MVVKDRWKWGVLHRALVNLASMVPALGRMVSGVGGQGKVFGIADATRNAHTQNFFVESRAISSSGSSSINS